jgi:monoamine oxidase
MPTKRADPGAPSPDGTPYDVIVVGGGFAGVSAAVELGKTRRVLLLEASGELGGRCRSKRVDYCKSRVDLGAHYFGVDHKRVRELVENLGLTGEVLDYIPSFGPDPTAICDFASRRVVTRVSETHFSVQGIDNTAPWSEQAKILTSLLLVTIICQAIDGRRPEASLFAKQLDAMTYADLVALFDLPSWFSDLMRAGAEGVWSQSAERMSLLYFLWYLKNNGGFAKIFNDQGGGPQQYGLRCGLQGLLEAHAATFHGDTRLDAPVRSIRVREDGVLVETRDGAVYEASDVIVAVTPKVAGGIAYEPELPAARRLLHTQRGGYAVKAVLFYDAPWWHASAETGVQMYAYLSRPGCEGVDWILASSPADGGYFALTVFLMPDLIDRCAGLGDDALRSAVGDAVVELVRDPRGRDFARMELCDWRKEPFVQGGPNTTFGPDVLTRVGSVFNRPDFGRVYFAGAEYATSFTGYVEGAIASGRFVAKQIKDHDAKPEGEGIRWLFLLAGLAALPACWAVIQVLRVADAVRRVVRRDTTKPGGSA